MRLSVTGAGAVSYRCGTVSYWCGSWSVTGARAVSGRQELEQRSLTLRPSAVAKTPDSRHYSPRGGFGERLPDYLDTGERRESAGEPLAPPAKRRRTSEEGAVSTTPPFPLSEGLRVEASQQAELFSSTDYFPFLRE